MHSLVIKNTKHTFHQNYSKLIDFQIAMKKNEQKHHIVANKNTKNLTNKATLSEQFQNLQFKIDTSNTHTFPSLVQANQ